MAQVSPNDNLTGLNSFVNAASPFTSPPYQQRVRTFSKGSVSSHESFWLSPESTTSTNSDSISSDFALASNESNFFGMDGGFNSSDPTSMPSYMPGHASSQHPAAFYHTLSGQANSLPHQTMMWRTGSVGTVLSQSIDSLALADEARKGNPSFHPIHGHAIKSEPDAVMSFTPQLYDGFHAFPNAPPMMASMSLPGYANPSLDRRLRLSDAESFASISSPSATSDAAAPSSRKRGAKRKSQGDVTESVFNTAPTVSDGTTSTKKPSKQSGQRRPPPSASHITESGKPFPVIDTSAKHSSLFVPPDTSGLTKREARLVKNRAAAFLSRQRKREQFEEMEIKCKGISMLVWRMWEVIAGPEASVDQLESTVLPSLLASEDPMARACLEEVIAKKGGSIAPTADVVPGFEDSPAPERMQSPALQRTSSAASTTTTAQTEVASTPASVEVQKQLDAAKSEIERLRSDLASGSEREKLLVDELNTLRSSASASSVLFEGAPVSHPMGNESWMPSQLPTNASARSYNMPSSGQAALPFRGTKGAELPLFVPESPMTKFTLGGLASPSFGFGGSLEAHESASFDLSKTPTLTMFSEQALRSRSSKHHDEEFQGRSAGLGLEYKCTSCSSAPSSPSAASCLSVDCSALKSLSTVLRGSGKPPSLLAMLLFTASLGLMSAVPGGDATMEDVSVSRSKTAPTGRVQRPLADAAKPSLVPAVKESHEADDQAAGSPSSHLSNDDLRLDMDIESTPLEDSKEGNDVDANASASTTPNKRPRRRMGARSKSMTAPFQA